MDLSGMIGSLLQQYTGGAAVAPAAADQHFDQVTQGVDQSSLSSAIGSMMRSSETAGFGQLVGQMFQGGNGTQQAGMLNAMLAGAAPMVLSQLSGLIPGFSGGSVTPAQAQALSPDAVSQIAAQAEKHDPSVVDRMSSVCAEHPTLVKTLGAGAMIVAMREVAKNFSPRQG